MNDSSHRKCVRISENEENAFTFRIIEHNYQRTFKGRFFSLVLRRGCEGIKCDFLLLLPNKLYVQSTWMSLARETESWRELLGNWKPQKLSPTLFSIFFTIIILFAFASLWLAFFHSVIFSQKKSKGRKFPHSVALCGEEGKILLLSELFNNLFRNRELISVQKKKYNFLAYAILSNWSMFAWLHFHFNYARSMSLTVSQCSSI